MFHRPLRNKLKDTRWYIAIQNGNGFDGDLRLAAPISDVKVRRLMVTEVHRDDDTQETGNFWHQSSSFE